MSSDKVETKTVDTKKEEETKPASEMTGTSFDFRIRRIRQTYNHHYFTPFQTNHRF